MIFDIPISLKGELFVSLLAFALVYRRVWTYILAMCIIIAALSHPFFFHHLSGFSPFTYTSTTYTLFIDSDSDLVPMLKFIPNYSYLLFLLVLILPKSIKMYWART